MMNPWLFGLSPSSHAAENYLAKNKNYCNLWFCFYNGDKEGIDHVAVLSVLLKALLCFPL